MKGAILGDIIGSRFEFSKLRKNKSEQFDLLTNKNYFTDDTVMNKIRIIKDLNYELTGIKGELSNYIGQEFEIVEEEYGTVFIDIDGHIQTIFSDEYEWI